MFYTIISDVHKTWIWKNAFRSTILVRPKIRIKIYMHINNKWITLRSPYQILSICLNHKVKSCFCVVNNKSTFVTSLNSFSGQNCKIFKMVCLTQTAQDSFQSIWTLNLNKGRKEMEDHWLWFEITVIYVCHYLKILGVFMMEKIYLTTYLNWNLDSVFLAPNSLRIFLSRCAQDCTLGWRYHQKLLLLVVEFLKI